jgi:nitroimidazol reductase NimA-like FMN-containing flavoprotein (pyridoxamine 5'-phosphate oxidase superfamily)
MPVEWLSQEKCRKMLGHQTYGRMATSGPDNLPYITPVNYVYLNDSIYIHTGFSGRKIENINSNPDVCFEISSPGNLYVSEKACGFSMRYWSIIIEGKASFVEDSAMKREVIDALMDKYSMNLDYTPPTDEELKRVNIIEISTDKISGKISVDPAE